MPLAYESLSHGEVVFGFFNIETDMVLLNQYFFFASDFSACVSDLAAREQGPVRADIDAYVLDERDAGDLMGAIQGTRYQGFIGETYKIFPFPAEPEAFRQNPEGYKTRGIIEGIITQYAPLTSITVREERDPASGIIVAIGEYVFTRLQFHNLLNYIWLGGYPRWKDWIRPPYVLDMRDAVAKSPHPLFGISPED